MKTLLFVVICILSFNIFAVDPAGMLKISTKYCELKVKEACEHLECVKNPGACFKKNENGPGVKQMKEDFEKASQGCREKDEECIGKNYKKIADQRVKDAAAEIQKERDNCKNGNQKSCWSIEQYDYSMKLYNSLE